MMENLYIENNGGNCVFVFYFPENIKKDTLFVGWPETTHVT